MVALSLITILDQEFGVSISGEKIKELNTIEELILFVNE
jgi:acyl carrier protein